MSITFIFIIFRPSLSGPLSFVNPLAAATTCIRVSCISVVVGFRVVAYTASVPIGHVVPTTVAIIHVLEMLDWVGRCRRTGLPELLLLLAIIFLLSILLPKLLLPKVLIVLRAMYTASSSATSSVAHTATPLSMIVLLTLLLIWLMKWGLELLLWWRLILGCGRCLVAQCCCWRCRCRGPIECTDNANPLIFS